MTVTDTPPGIPSPARLAGWLNDHVPGGPVELTDIQLIAGGRSNLTYRLTVSEASGGSGAAEASGDSGAAGSRLLVLRRPPLGHVLPTAHDMSREFRVLSALADTPVPVAPLVAACTDDEVIGSPFYVMEHVPGVVLRTRADTKELTNRRPRTCRGAWPTCWPRSMAWTWPRSGSATSAAAPDTCGASSTAGSGSGSCPRPGRCPATPSSWKG